MLTRFLFNKPMDHSFRPLVLSTPQGYASIEEKDGALGIIYNGKENANQAESESLRTYKYPTLWDGGPFSGTSTRTSQFLDPVRETHLQGGNKGCGNSTTGNLSVGTITRFLKSLKHPPYNRKHLYAKLSQGGISLKSYFRTPLGQNHDGDIDISNKQKEVNETKTMGSYRNESSVTKTECSDSEGGYLKPTVNHVLDVMVTDNVNGMSTNENACDSAIDFSKLTRLGLANCWPRTKSACIAPLNSHSGKKPRSCICIPMTSQDCISRRRRIRGHRNILQRIMTCLQHKAS